MLSSILTSAQSLEDFFSSSNQFFKTYVNDGKVDYKRIYENPSALNSILNNAKHINVSVNDENTYKAFWINAYNLLVIQEVINNHPLKSPLDVKGFFDKKTHQIGNGNYTLNSIENELLRGNFTDPRIHFVLVCGAKGCPPIISTAYKPEHLESKLTEQTKKAINGSFIQINAKEKKVLVSQIMEWYKEDFLLNGNEIDFLNLYLDGIPPSNYILFFFH
jgi:hypothetical protein